MKECPICELASPDNAERCDCLRFQQNSNTGEPLSFFQRYKSMFADESRIRSRLSVHGRHEILSACQIAHVESSVRIDVLSGRHPRELAVPLAQNGGLPQLALVRRI